MLTGVPAAVLFDMDGLLVDSEPLWTVAEHELAASLGGTFTEGLKARIVGTRLEVAVTALVEHCGLEPTPDRVRAAGERVLARMVELLGPPPGFLPGVPELVADLRAAGVPLALVSSSFRLLVDAVLVHAPGWFALTVAGDEVARGKPRPDGYLLAAQRLGVDPAACVVLEDSPAGVVSGLAAGCAVLAVPSVPAVRLAPAERLTVRPDLVGVSTADLAALVGR